MLNSSAQSHLFAMMKTLRIEFFKWSCLFPKGREIHVIMILKNLQVLKLIF